MLTETVLLAVLGGLLGVIVSFWFFDLLRLTHFDARMDWRLYGLAASGAVLLGVLVGLLPALRSSRAGLTESLKEGSQSSGGPRRHRLRNFLVSSEVAMALVLRVIAGLMTRAFFQLYSSDLGFDPEKTVVIRVDLRADHYRKPESRYLFAERGLEAMRQMPGVEAAAVSANHNLLF